MPKYRLVWRATFSAINEAQKNRISCSLLQWSDPQHYTPPAPHEQQCPGTNYSDSIFVTLEGRSQKSEVAAGLPHRRLEHGAFADDIGSQKVLQPRALRGVLPLTNPNLPCSMLVSIPERPVILPIYGSVTSTRLHLHWATCRRLRRLFTHPSLPLRRHEKAEFHRRTWRGEGAPGNSSERSCACRRRAPPR